MIEKISRNRVNGFLKAEERRIVNSKGEEFLPLGVAFGNWLLCEGNMWAFGEGNPYDRPRRFETLIRDLCGSAYATGFWKRFRDNFITEADVEAIADIGFNSVRIPINWRVLMEDEPGIAFIEEGFQLIDRCIDWCEKYHLYVFLDLHGAPGGQTGAHIDDSIDNKPRLFMDADSYEKCLALCREIARRYRDRWIVGGYDLLNEPIDHALPNMSHWQARLAAFYEDCIRVIREEDDRHILILEGTRCDTDPGVFYKVFDPNMVVSFHLYGQMPCEETYAQWIEVSQRLNVPLWLGETGRGRPEMFTSLYTLALQLGIGVNFWPWKRTNWQVGCCANLAPDGWREIVAYTRGGPRPSYQRAQELLNAFVEGLLFKNCVKRQIVVDAVLRRPKVRVPGFAFDYKPSEDNGHPNPGNPYAFRVHSGHQIVLKPGYTMERQAYMDLHESVWDAMTLKMDAGEQARYTIMEVAEPCPLYLEMRVLTDAEVTVKQDEMRIASVSIKANAAARPLIGFVKPSKESCITVSVDKGSVELNTLCFGDVPEDIYPNGFLEM